MFWGCLLYLHHNNVIISYACIPSADPLDLHHFPPPQFKGTSLVLPPPLMLAPRLPPPATVLPLLDINTPFPSPYNSASPSSLLHIHTLSSLPYHSSSLFHLNVISPSPHHANAAIVESFKEDARTPGDVKEHHNYHLVSIFVIFRVCILMAPHAPSRLRRSCVPDTALRLYQPTPPGWCGRRDLCPC